jgi:hypothetical protein
MTVGRVVDVASGQTLSRWNQGSQRLTLLNCDRACKVEGDPQEIFAAIEKDLRARLAVPVDSKEPLQTVGNSTIISTI